MKYNKTNAAGIHITEASPLDDRTQLKTEAEIAVMINKGQCLTSCLMVWVTFSDTKNPYLDGISTRPYGRAHLSLHGMMIFRGRITLVNCTICSFR
jgi:hypothetical protein